MVVNMTTSCLNNFFNNNYTLTIKNNNGVNIATITQIDSKGIPIEEPQIREINQKLEEFIKDFEWHHSFVYSAMSSAIFNRHNVERVMLDTTSNDSESKTFVVQTLKGPYQVLITATLQALIAAPALAVHYLKRD